MMITQRNRSKSKELLKNFRNRSFHRLQEEDDPQQLSVSPSVADEKGEDEIEGLGKRIMDFQFNLIPINDPPQEDYIDPGAKRMAEFIYALYGKQAKRSKSLVHRINGTWKRTFVENGVDRDLRRAEKLRREVSVSCCPDGVEELTRLDVYEFRGELENWTKRVLDLISAYDSQTHSLIVRVAKATDKFIEHWNKAIPCLDGQFLYRYGVVQTDDVKLNVIRLVGALKIIQKCTTVPKEIAALRVVHFERVVASSNRVYTTLRARERQPMNFWRYSLPA